LALPEKRITATTCQLESMIRLPQGTCAHASLVVQLCDVHGPHHLMRDTTPTSALDPTMGKIGMGLLNISMGQQQCKLREDIQKEVLSLLGTSNTAASHAVFTGQTRYNSQRTRVAFASTQVSSRRSLVPKSQSFHLGLHLPRHWNAKDS
jgi:DNA replicative helicase MCM subunit Mcm2 (Cdc46/Mcm family)